MSPYEVVCIFDYFFIYTREHDSKHHALYLLSDSVEFQPMTLQQMTSTFL